MVLIYSCEVFLDVIGVCFRRLQTVLKNVMIHFEKFSMEVPHV